MSRETEKNSDPFRFKAHSIRNTLLFGSQTLTKYSLVASHTPITSPSHESQHTSRKGNRHHAIVVSIAMDPNKAIETSSEELQEQQQQQHSFRPPPTFSTLPAVLHALVFVHLGLLDCLNVIATARWLKQHYLLASITVSRPQQLPLTYPSLHTLLPRCSPNLLVLKLRVNSALETFAAAILMKTCPHVTSLKIHLYQRALAAGAKLDALAVAIKAGDGQLSRLSLLSIQCWYTGTHSDEIIRDAPLFETLGKGFCPLLQRLKLNPRLKGVAED